jgi:zona occludens toxin
MIELYEGVPGSGKSYYAVAERLLPWVRAGRRLYVYVRGFHLDRLAAFTGLPLEDLQKQITLLWPDEANVLTLHQHVEPGAAVFIDEAQTIFRALQRVEPSLLRWLETHRHYGVDVLMTCQDHRQMTASVTRLVEVTVKFRRLDRLGFKNRYQGFIRGNPEEQEVIRTLTGKYEPTIYQYYASYAQAGVLEERQGVHVWKNPKVALGVMGLTAALLLFVARPWVTAGAEPIKPLTSMTREQAAQMGGHTSAQAEIPPSRQPMELSPAASPRVIRIVGGGGYVEGPVRKWRYLLESGELLTATQLAARYGIAVREYQDGGVLKVQGEGIVYGTGGD